MAARRILSVSLPASDPATAAIESWLRSLPAGTDVSGEARRLLALSLNLRGPLERIEAQLASLAARGSSPAPPADDDEAAATMERLFSFDV